MGEVYTTDGYTSGALTSDENIRDINQFQNSEPEFSSLVLMTATTSKGNGGDLDMTQPPAPSPGYRDGVYEPLSTICLETKSKQSFPSFSRKK